MSNPAVEDKTKADDDWREATSEMTPGELYLFLLENDILTDCTFVVGSEEGETREFKAHRLQLASASPVFEKMLTGEMVEAKTGHVRVTDLSPNTFQLLLRFIYAYENEFYTFEEARDVAFAAHKYIMKPLLASAVDDLCSLLTPENVWTALEIAQLLQQKQLHDACIEVLRIETELLFSCENFTLISEEHLAILLQQDKLNVEDELDLVNIAVHWARHEARRRGLADDDEGVRAVLEPRLLPLLRFLALKPHQFLTGPGLAGWLTSEEKSAIDFCLQTKDFSRFPSHLSSAKKRQKMKSKGRKRAKGQRILRELVENQKRSNLFVQNVHSIVQIQGDYFRDGVYAKLVFRVKSECILLGFDCLSRYRATNPDPTILAEPMYEENILAQLYRLNTSLSADLKAVEISRTEIRGLSMTYNSKMRVLFDERAALCPHHWFAIEIKLMVDPEESPWSIQYENPVRAQNACAFGLEVVFHTKELEGFQTSQNDGLFQSLLFLKILYNHILIL